MKREMSFVAGAEPLWKSDINYPGAPPEPVASRAKGGAKVPYDAFVLQYQSTQRLNAALVAFGIAGAIGAMFYAPVPFVYVAVAVCLALGVGGLAGYAAAWTSHARYCDMATSYTETYAQPPPKAQPVTVRPFVASRSTSGKTTNTGRLDFTPEVWQSFFNLALRKGTVNRDDVAKPSGMGREWYHGAGYGVLLSELTRLGFIDGDKALTPAALNWYHAQIALPLAAVRSRSHTGTNERPNDSDRTEGGQGEY